MPTKFDFLLIVDLEATCWEKEKKPEGQTSEIIEVGICLFDLSQWKPVDKKQIVVAPLMSEVSKYCTDLTGWTLDQLLEKGTSLKEACDILRNDLNSKRRVWASWGDYDRWMFEEDCRRKAIPYPFGTKHINLKTLFAIHYQLSREVGMKNALDKLRLELEGILHSGVDDAWNIGRILEKQGRF